MVKRIVFAAFVLDDGTFLDGGVKPVDLKDFTQFLGKRLAPDDGIRDWIAWSNFEDMQADHEEYGLTAEFIEGHVNG